MHEYCKLRLQSATGILHRLLSAPSQRFLTIELRLLLLGGSRLFVASRAGFGHTEFRPTHATHTHPPPLCGLACTGQPLMLILVQPSCGVASSSCSITSLFEAHLQHPSLLSRAYIFFAGAPAFVPTSVESDDPVFSRSGVLPRDCLCMSCSSDCIRKSKSETSDASPRVPEAPRTALWNSITPEQRERESSLPRSRRKCGVFPTRQMGVSSALLRHRRAAQLE